MAKMVKKTKPGTEFLPFDESKPEEMVIYLDATNDELPLNPEDYETPFAFLVADFNSINIEQTYEMLKSKIKLGENRLDVDVLSEAVDEAPEWSYKAAQLYIITKDMADRFNDVTFEIKFAEFSELAQVALEKQKKAGDLSGVISKEKIKNWIILNIHEYTLLLQQKSELNMAAEAFKSLSAQFESKKSLLQTQGRLSERKKIVIS